MRDEEQVLAANQAFYDAFARRDVAAMAAQWAMRAPVACVHPGWQALFGREAVLASWRGILEGPNPPVIRCTAPTAHVFGEAALVICTERLPGVELVATNYFVREDGAWKLAHHQAGGVARPGEEREESDENDDNDESDDESGLLH
ncbi:MAG: nuclear transport factor 2 family protein [bacterium]